jgi:hypothetical protein
MEYAQYEVETSPAWLRGPWGERWNEVSGLIKDAWRDAARQAVKARFVAFAPRDALAQLLRDFALDDPYEEPEATTRSRLARAWETWQRAGTRRGLVAALEAAGYANVAIKEWFEWNHTGRWWDFWVVLRPPFAWDNAAVRAAKWGRRWRWGDATRLASGFPKGEAARVTAIVRKWKPAHAHCVNVIVLLSGRLWGDGMRWGDGFRYGGTVALWRV